jgi:hypothetical protein
MKNLDLLVSSINSNEINELVVFIMKNHPEFEPFLKAFCRICTPAETRVEYERMITEIYNNTLYGVSGNYKCRKMGNKNVCKFALLIPEL